MRSQFHNRLSDAVQCYYFIEIGFKEYAIITPNYLTCSLIMIKNYSVAHRNPFAN